MPQSGTWGMQDQNGQWDGIVQELAANRADITGLVFKYQKVKSRSVVISRIGF